MIAAQNNAIRDNYIKAKIDDRQQKNKSKSRGERDETVNQTMSKYSKVALKKGQEQARLGGKGDSMGIVEEIEILSYDQMVYVQIRMRS